MGVVRIGVDIGQKVDPTAIAVVEPVERHIGKHRETHHMVRYLQRLQLGTSYPEVGARLAQLAAQVREWRG